MSAVFRSEVTTKWKVAISTPVRNKEQAIIGVVAMTVELGELFDEDLEQDDSQTGNQRYAVVVDGRPGDHQGVILQHPLYDRLVADKLSVPDRHTRGKFRVDLDVLRNRQSLRTTKIRFHGTPNWAALSVEIGLPVWHRFELSKRGDAAGSKLTRGCGCWSKSVWTRSLHPWSRLPGGCYARRPGHWLSCAP